MAINIIVLLLKTMKILILVNSSSNPPFVFVTFFDKKNNTFLEKFIDYEKNIDEKIGSSGSFIQSE